MRFKELIKELILPSFWFFFIVAYSHNNYKSSGIKMVTDIKRQEIIFNTVVGINNKNNFQFNRALLSLLKL
jgi:hypothetical protein